MRCKRRHLSKGDDPDKGIIIGSSLTLEDIKFISTLKQTLKINKVI